MSFNRNKLVHTAVVIIKIIKMTIIMYRKCHKSALNFLAEERDKTNRVIWFIQREILCVIAVFFFMNSSIVIFYLNLFHNITVLVTMSVFFFLVCSNEQLTIVLPFWLLWFFFFICWWKNFSEVYSVYIQWKIFIIKTLICICLFKLVVFTLFPLF